MKRELPKTLCSEARAALEIHQETLIEALLEGNSKDIPVSAPQIGAGARSLLLKRARAIARAHPQVLDKGSEAFIATMKEYAALYPGVHPQGCCADTAQYLRFCQNRWRQSASISNKSPTIAELIRRWQSMLRSF